MRSIVPSCWKAVNTTAFASCSFTIPSTHDYSSEFTRFYNWRIHKVAEEARQEMHRQNERYTALHMALHRPLKEIRNGYGTG